VYISAGVKMGKSELANALAAHFIMKHEQKVFMAKPEEHPHESIKRIAGHVAKGNFIDPNLPFDKDLYLSSRQTVSDNIFFVDGYQHLGWNSLKQDIYYMNSLGVNVVFIDPITNLVSGVESSEQNNMLERIAKDAAVIAKDLNMLVIFFCHLKTHDRNITLEQRQKLYSQDKYIGIGNCPHEMGGEIYSNQFHGSRAMMRSCHMMVGMEGNKDVNIPDRYKNMRVLKLLEDRTFGASGSFPISFNPITSTYQEL
jgi:twinkle protein